MCVCVCVPARRAPKWTGKLQFELRARPNDQIHTKYVQMAGYESIHLNTVYVLSGREQLGENPMCVNILYWQYIIVNILKWQTGAWTINVNQRTKCERKSPTALNLNNVIALISINLSIHTVKTMQCSFTFDYFLDFFCNYYLPEH